MKNVVSNFDYGDDSPLYGAMGFVRKSNCASGLTGKTKMPVKLKLADILSPQYESDIVRK